MRTPLSRRPRAGIPRLLAVLALAAATAATASACGSSHPAAPKASASSSAAALSQDCTAVTDVLANGPDPDSDSAGYAEAQILPLKQITFGDSAVRAAVDRLDTAFGSYTDAPASARTQAGAKVTSAEDALNALCPGAAP